MVLAFDILRLMSDSQDEIVELNGVVESIKAEIAKSSPNRRQRIFEAIALAALGSIPWLGGVLAAGAGYRFHESDVKRDELLGRWLQEHHQTLGALRATLEQIVTRVDGFGSEVEQRITSDQYLTLVRKTFRQWDASDTEEKRALLV